MQPDTERVKIRKNMRLRQRIIALIGNLVYTLLRLFQPKVNLQLTAQMYPDIVTNLELQFGALIPQMEVANENI